MPTYEYECSKGHQFEVSQRITDPPLSRCRFCRGKVRRLISGGTFILKGGGWYKDGYSTAPTNGGESKAESGSGAEKPSTTAPKSEDKSSSKSDS
jgi:putative FmdB family regulatory protein